jgi:hypothetical protein
MPDNFDVTVGMAVWDEELWRNFEGSMKGLYGTRAASKRSAGRTDPIALRLLLWSVVALLALL